MKGNRRILFFSLRPLERIVEPSRRPLIEIEHVFVTYPGTERHILNDFNLTLYEGGTCRHPRRQRRGQVHVAAAVARRAVAGSDRSPARGAGALAWAGRADPSPLTGRKVTSLVSAMQQERVVHQSGGWTASVGPRRLFRRDLHAQQPTSEMCETAYQLVRLLGGVHL